MFSIKALGARSAADKSVLHLLLFLCFNLRFQSSYLATFAFFRRFSDCFPTNDLNGLNVLNEWNVLSFLWFVEPGNRARNAAEIRRIGLRDIAHVNRILHAVKIHRRDREVGFDMIAHDDGTASDQRYGSGGL
jgi:hypothetical protein